jgi:hypothetical protein
MIEVITKEHNGIGEKPVMEVCLAGELLERSMLIYDCSFFFRAR